MKYFHVFKNESERAQYIDENYEEPYLSTVGYDVDTIQYELSEEERRKIKYGKPLTFEIQSDGDIRWKKNATASIRTIEYSKNGGEWTSITSASGDTAPSISVVSGDTVQFRGNNASYGINSPSYYNCFSGSTCSFSLNGNIMSLINSTDFSDLTTLESACTFYYLFRDCTGLTDASKLLLPATILAYYCYSGMFQGCTSLTGVPALPAETLASYCYSGMFADCSALTGVPSNYLPVKTLASYCYQSMFGRCTRLTQAPELPATTLARNCYAYMFEECRSLTGAPSLPTTTLAFGCYNSMFQSCSKLTQAPELPATTLAENCYAYMFRYCSSLTTAPELPAKTLANSCYFDMFYSCVKLDYIKCLATDISATYCTTDWVYGVNSTGTFVKTASTDWSSKAGGNGIPSGWTVENV